MKYMTMKDFYELAKKNKACEEGLCYLKAWMKEHPKTKNVKTFFNDHKSIKKSHIKILEDVKGGDQYWFLETTIERYFIWIAETLIDYNNIKIKVDNYHFRISRWLEKYYKTSYLSTTSHKTIMLLLLYSFNEDGEE